MRSTVSFKVLVILLILNCVVTEEHKRKPNIVMIVADDLGWNDVSFHGSNQIPTPNIDLLAYTGVSLGRYYSHCICTPSRAALLTGKNAHTLGMQGFPLTNGEDRGLPITEKILPQYLKEHGYKTHLVGKWHVGHAREEYLPTNRGFDSYLGHRGGYVDYYQYVLEETWDHGKEFGFDLFKNTTPAWDTEGYLTDVYNQEAKSIIERHDEESPLFLMVSHQAPHSGNDGALLQAPPEEIRAMRHIASPHRRIYAAMVKKLDDSVGEIMETLNRKGILENTIVVFVSDNGGMTSGDSLNYASNYPLRGLKMSPYEGGIRVTGLLWSLNLNSSHNLWNGYMHVSDWVPTLLRAAGLPLPADVDGNDLWHNILENKDSKRHEVFEIDDYTGFATIISDNYKLVRGNSRPAYSNHQGEDLQEIIGDGPSYTDALQKSKLFSILETNGKPFDFKSVNIRKAVEIKCNKGSGEICYSENDKVCLFDIKEDPCEYQNIADKFPDVVLTLEARLNSEMERVVPRVVPLYRDPRGSPRLFNFTWATWAEGLD